MYTADEQKLAEEYVQRERGVTLRLAGMTEDELTDEQEIALTRYVRVSAAVHLAKYGPEGPRGNVLRMETEAETAARLEWEEAIKSPEQKRKDRVTQAILDQEPIWCTGHQLVRVRWYEYIAQGDATDQDAMYDIIATVCHTTGWSEHDLYDVRLAVAVQPDETINLVSIWVNLNEVHHKDYEDYIANVSEEEE
jgi:hypothetical protein